MRTIDEVKTHCRFVGEGIEKMVADGEDLEARFEGTQIIRFKVDAEDSYVSYSNGWFGYHVITLSPYCVPVFTLALLPWRFTTGTATPLFLAGIDILIGFTYAFHVCCWVRQTRLHQTDIIGPGIVRSLLIIATVHILNFCLVLLTPSSGVVLAIQRVFWEYPSLFVSSLSGGIF